LLDYANCFERSPKDGRFDGRKKGGGVEYYLKRFSKRLRGWNDEKDSYGRDSRGAASRGVRGSGAKRIFGFSVRGVRAVP